MRVCDVCLLLGSRKPQTSKRQNESKERVLRRAVFFVLTVRVRVRAACPGDRRLVRAPLIV